MSTTTLESNGTSFESSSSSQQTDRSQSSKHSALLGTRAKYTEVGDHTWKFVFGTSEEEPSVIGFGSVPIPSYDHIAKLSPDRRISVRCITWNINEKPAKIITNLSEELGNTLDCDLDDIISISLQELPAATTTFHEEALRLISESLADTHAIYVSFRAWSQMIMIFIRKSHMKFVTKDPSIKFVSSTAIPKPARTKGGIGVCFRIYQRWIVIVACHLSHATIQERIQDFHKITKNLKFASLMNYTGSEEISAADVVIWAGDLNFRINNNLGINWAENEDNRKEDIQRSLEYDDLIAVQKKELAFTEFKEGQILFPPTHKYLMGKDEYDATRVPSYTDRVLYWARKPEWVEVGKYIAIPKLTQSDHKPVSGTFRVNVISKPIPTRYYSEGGSSLHKHLHTKTGGTDSFDSTSSTDAQVHNGTSSFDSSH